MYSAKENNTYDNIKVSDEMMERWAKAQALYMQSNPHIEMDSSYPLIEYTSNRDGSINANLKGTDLTLNIPVGEWEWIG